jgi:hypothetical protein
MHDDGKVFFAANPVEPYWVLLRHAPRAQSGN